MTAPNTHANQNLQLSPLNDELDEKSSRHESPPQQEHELKFLFGWRLYSTTFGMCLGLFLVNLEVTIVSTSSLVIANDLHSHDRLGWILTGYLITYTGFIMIWAKASDVFGRKTCILTSLTLFTIFSGGCGAVQTISQLIICRVFQGVGAAGGYALTLVVFHGMVSAEKFPLYGSIMASVVALANLAGPLVGGALSKPSSWRWVFLLNVPAGTLAVIILSVSIPTGFPYHTNRSKILDLRKLEGKAIFLSLKRLDLLGASLLLAASLLLTAGLLEGGSEWAWSSAGSITTLTVSGVLWVAFFWWERQVSADKREQEPIFPWRFLHNRLWMGDLLTSLLNGLPFYSLVICIPQRFETVNGESPVQTGIKLLPFTLVAAFGSIIANGIVVKGRVAAIYVMWFFSALTTIGAGLLTTIPSSETITKATYGYEALAGLGIGGTWGLAVLYVSHLVEQRDVATAYGALVEFRILGGALGIAIMTATMENYLRKHLASLVSPELLNTVLKSTAVIHELPVGLKAKLVRVFADGYTLQMKIIAGLSAAQILAIGLIWSNPQLSVLEKKQEGSG